MKQYILTYRDGVMRPSIMEFLKKTLVKNQITILDDSYQKAILVNANPTNMGKAKPVLNDKWIVSENSQFDLPDTRKKINH